jgi:beta-lactamase class A
MIALVLAATLTLPPQKADATIGAVAINLESGRQVSARGEERFPLGSVYKLPIALAVLHLVDSGKLPLERKVTIAAHDFSPGWSPIRDRAKSQPVTLTVNELLRSMVAVSDNTACDSLLRLIGGPSVVQRRLDELGFAGIHVDRQEREIAHDLDRPGGVEQYVTDARDSATPMDMSLLLAAVWHGKVGLTKTSHAMLLQWMTETETGQRRIKAAMPPGSVVAHKTGTMPGTCNDAAIVTSPDGHQHVVVVVFTRAGKGDVEPREDDLAAAARAAYDAVLH